MIVDTFLFHDELEILYSRLHLLYDHVDVFILVEANKSFTMIDYPFVYEENKHYFQKFADKIIHVKVEDIPSNEDIDTYNYMKDADIIVHTSNKTDGAYACVRQYHQREVGVRRGLTRLNLNDNDLVVHSDLDEIYDPKVIPCVRNRLKIKGSELPCLNLQLDYFHGNFEYRFIPDYEPDKTIPYYWPSCAFAYWKEIKNYFSWFHGVRRWRWDYPNYTILKNEFFDTGLHMKFFGNNEQLMSKIQSYAHHKDMDRTGGVSDVSDLIKYLDTIRVPVKPTDKFCSIYEELKKSYYPNNYKGEK